MSALDQLPFVLSQAKTAELRWTARENYRQFGCCLFHQHRYIARTHDYGEEGEFLCEREFQHCRLLPGVVCQWQDNREAVEIWAQVNPMEKSNVSKYKVTRARIPEGETAGSTPAGPRTSSAD